MLNFLENISEIFDQVQNIWESIVGMFSDVDFSVLYNWLPSDIGAVCAAVITVLIFLALIGLVKKAILFLG